MPASIETQQSGLLRFGVGHRQTARKAAVTVLRGNGGTFPSRPEKSGATRPVQQPGEGAIQMSRNAATSGVLDALTAYLRTERDPLLVIGLSLN